MRFTHPTAINPNKADVLNFTSIARYKMVFLVFVPPSLPAVVPFRNRTRTGAPRAKLVLAEIQAVFAYLGVTSQAHQGGTVGAALSISWGKITYVR